MLRISLCAMIISFGISSAWAEIVNNTDVTANIGSEVQGSESRSLALPGRLTVNEFSMFDNPARSNEAAGIYLDCASSVRNTWGGVLVSLPFSVTIGIFVHRGLSETSPLRNFLVEPRSGRMGAFSSMVDSTMKIGSVDGDSEYFRRETVLPNKSVSELTTGNGRTKGFGNIDLTQSIRVWMLNLGLMESFSSSSFDTSDRLADASERSIRYRASEKRITGGISTAPIGFLESEFSFTTATYDASFDYSASTSSSFPIFEDESLSESIHCRSAANSEIGCFFRTIATINPAYRISGSFRYTRYELPVDVWGKSAVSDSAASHELRYSTSAEFICVDLTLQQTAGENCHIIYSAGYSMISQTWTKVTETAPTATDASIWGAQRISDRRKTDISIIPVGVACTYRVDDRVTLRSGIRKYIYADYGSRFRGVCGSASSASATNGRSGIADNFFAGAGASVKLTAGIMCEADVSVGNSCLSESDSRDESVSAGLTIRYLF